MSYIIYPRPFAEDPVVVGPLLPFSNEAQQQTYNAALEAARIALVLGGRDFSNDASIAHVGHNLGVMRRRFMAFTTASQAIPTSQISLQQRCYDALIIADGDGAVSVDKLTNSNSPDQHELLATIDQLWPYSLAAYHSYDVLMIEHVISHAVAHYNSIASRRYVRERQRNRREIS